MDAVDWGAATLAASVLGLAASLWFIGWYLWWAGADAWRNPFGRYLVTRKALLALLFATFILGRLGPEWWREWRRPLMALLVTAFALQTFVPYRLLRMAQDAAREEERVDR